MTYIDPITKKYYDIFTYGRTAEKLAEIENFYNVYRYIMDEMVPVTNQFGGIITAQMVKAIVDKNGTGYALLNVLGRRDDMTYPFDTITDIAWIEKGILHTWFPYPQLAFYKKDGSVKVISLQNTTNYATKERALKFIRTKSMDTKLHDNIAKGIFNGIYVDLDLGETLREAEVDIVPEITEPAETKKTMTVGDMIDDWGVQPKELHEEVEEFKQNVFDSEMKMLFDKTAEASDIETEEKTESEDVIEADFIDVEVVNKPVEPTKLEPVAQEPDLAFDFVEPVIIEKPEEPVKQTEPVKFEDMGIEEVDDDDDIMSKFF